MGAVPEGVKTEKIGYRGVTGKEGDELCKNGVTEKSFLYQGFPDVPKALGPQSMATTPDIADAQAYAVNAAKNHGDRAGMVFQLSHDIGSRPRASIDTPSRPPVPEMAIEMQQNHPFAMEQRTSLQADGTYGETALLPNAHENPDIRYYLTPVKKFDVATGDDIPMDHILEKMTLVLANQPLEAVNGRCPPVTSGV